MVSDDSSIQFLVWLSQVTQLGLDRLSLHSPLRSRSFWSIFRTRHHGSPPIRWFNRHRRTALDNCVLGSSGGGAQLHGLVFGWMVDRPHGDGHLAPLNKSPEGVGLGLRLLCRFGVLAVVISPFSEPLRSAFRYSAASFGCHLFASYSEHLFGACTVSVTIMLGFDWIPSVRTLRRHGKRAPDASVSSDGDTSPPSLGANSVWGVSLFSGEHWANLRIRGAEGPLI